MVIVAEFELIGNPETVVFVKSLEQFFCPCCHSNKCKVIGTRTRKLIKTCGTKITMIIRRLKCKVCGKIHHELPATVVPYKRHAAESIEAVLEDKLLLNTPADESTLKRWRLWFNGLALRFLGILESAARKSALKTDAAPITGNAIKRIRFCLGCGSGWLERLVQTVVKTNNWVHTRSAFAAG